MSEITDKYHKQDTDLTEMHLRMKRLERATGWYDSISRRLIILAVTYAAGLLLMLALNIGNPWLEAIVPAVPVAVDLLAELILRKRMTS